MTDRREQIAFLNQQKQYNRERRPVRHIPTQAQLEAGSRQEPSKHYIGSSSGFHVEEDAYGLEEDESYYKTNLPTSARRYQVSPEQVYQSGNQRYHVRYVDVPKRSSQQKQLPPERERHTDAYEALPYSKRHLHPVLWIGIFFILLILGWIGLNFVTSWYQGVQNDWMYGQQRHFEINAVVGHGDSQSNASYFTAENNNGQIIVIELPGGNVNKARIYQIETVPGNVGNPPVKLTFQDMNGDGKPDMIVQIGDGAVMIYLTLYNNGTEFVSKL